MAWGRWSNRLTRAFLCPGLRCRVGQCGNHGSRVIPQNHWSQKRERDEQGRLWRSATSMTIRKLSRDCMQTILANHYTDEDRTPKNFHFWPWQAALALDQGVVHADTLLRTNLRNNICLACYKNSPWMSF